MKSEISLDQYLDNLDDDVGLAEALGRQLRMHREALGLSIGDLSGWTRISVRFLEAIERGDHKVLPGGGASVFRDIASDPRQGKAYIKGYIRTYAKHVNFNSGIEVESADEPMRPKRDMDVRDRHPERTSVVQRRPPWLAEYLLYLFLTREERVYLIGDLAEEYDDVLEKFGAEKADLWFYKQVWTSLHPLILRALRRLRTVVIIVEVMNKLRGL